MVGGEQQEAGLPHTGFVTCTSLHHAVSSVYLVQDSLEMSTGGPSVITSPRAVELG